MDHWSFDLVIGCDLKSTPEAKLEAVQALHAKLTAGDRGPGAARKQPPKRDVVEARHGQGTSGGWCREFLRN